jgi:hypothetical protein
MEFSDIAYAKFLQTAPELSTLILTFQDVSDELSDNSDIKVGIFILRNGDDVMFVPVISKGEGVYPIDSIFVSSKGKFFPLTKNTVETILNTQRPAMGQAKKLPDTATANPSVNDLVNPPRTGKFVYASQSRFTEFLSSIPTNLKEIVLEKFAEDKEVYNKLHKMFGIESIVRALKATKLDEATQPRDRSVGARVITGGDNLPNPQVNSILTRGYAIDGQNPLTRVALATDYWEDSRFTNMSSLDTGFDYDIVMKDGTIRTAFVPMVKTINFYDGKPRVSRPGEAEPHFVLFDNGDFSIRSGVVIVGERKEDKGVAKRLFNMKPPMLLREVNSGDRIAVFDEHLHLIGVYDASSVTITNQGVDIRASDLTDHSRVTIHAIRGYSKTPLNASGEMFLPTSCIVVKLGSNLLDILEDNAQSANKRKEILDWALMNTTMNITHDDVEFFINGVPMGKEASVMKALVEDEGIAPEAAESFVKAAKEKKKVTVYLSKKADFGPNEIPQGVKQPKTENNFGPGVQRNKMMPQQNLKDAVNTGDNQTVESVVISELLQSPDLYEHINEYLPDIEEAIDRLGRILFLGRIHINKLGEGNDADEVFSFLALLRNVYKMLGDNFIKLQRLVGNAPKE